MAFTYTNLTSLAGGNGFTLWHYSTTDAKATVDAADYFLDAVDRLVVGDVIICSDTNVPTTTLMVVLTNTGSAVDVSDGTAISLTDSR
jgi:hypothetical protein